jgi:hypothetical protein
MDYSKSLLSSSDFPAFLLGVGDVYGICPTGWYLFRRVVLAPGFCYLI